MMINVQNAVDKGELTQLEGKMIDWLLSDGYYAEKHFSDVDVTDVAKGISVSVNSAKGILGSLVKKGYLFTDTIEESGYDIIYANEKCYLLDDDYEDNWKEYK
jgi:predicted transcriptional regulator of viral defense system